MGKNSTLILENTSIRGNIEVQAWDHPKIKLAAEIHAANAYVDSSLSNGVLNIKLRREGIVSTEPVHFWVWVPATCEVELSTVSGKITVRGVRARLKALTIDGNIELVDISSQNVDATSSTSGNITLSSPLNHQGKHHLYSAAGRIDVIFREPASFTLDAVTREGRIQMDGFNLSDGYRSDRHVEGVYGNGQAILMLRTVRGVIQLRKQ
ncbi:MAG: DUF4097 family beta strand repeat protein [Acidobacteria bacterium]|nr:DUF4097 family beta strand repeat protein [Acidobacteriota bacterium]